MQTSLYMGCGLRRYTAEDFVRLYNVLPFPGYFSLVLLESLKYKKNNFLSSAALMPSDPSVYRLCKAG